jgi:hypothetical protein
MYLTDPGCGDWAFRVVEQNSVSSNESSTEISVFSASRIIEAQIKKPVTPLICKIDIEGGEVHLFRKIPIGLTNSPY